MKLPCLLLLLMSCLSVGCKKTKLDAENLLPLSNHLDFDDPTDLVSYLGKPHERLAEEISDPSDYQFGLETCVGDCNPDHDMMSQPVESDKVLPSCTQDNIELNVELVYTKRLVASILGHITGSESSLSKYIAHMTINDEDFSSLQRFLSSAEVGNVQGAVEAVINSIDRIEAVQPMSFSPVQWISDNQSILYSTLQILLIILIVYVLLVLTVRIWWYFGFWRTFFFFITLSFFVSVPWTWVHMYKQNLAARLKRADNRPDVSLPPFECDPQTFSWYQLLTYDSSKCAKYYEDLVVEPFWEVKPTQAIAITFVEFVWKPLAIMGEPLGIFIRDLMAPLPFWMKPVVAVLGLVFLWWCLVLMSGMKVWTWFFSVEPANTTQHEMAAINNTVNDLRQIIMSAAESNASKDSELRDIMTELRAQVEGQSGIAEVLPVMGEMVPVLQEMCADYAQQQNSVPGYGRQISVATVGRSEHIVHGGGDTVHGGGDAAYNRGDTVRGGGDAVYNRGDAVHSGGDTSFLPSKVFSICRPDHLVLTTANSEAIIDFYTALGMEIKTFGSSRKALHMNQFKINIHIVGAEVSPHADKPSPGCLDICLACSCSVDVTLQHLKNKNIKPILGPVKRTGALGPITSVYLRDPDGNLVELGHYQQDDITTNNLVTENSSKDVSTINSTEVSAPM